MRMLTIIAFCLALPLPFAAAAQEGGQVKYICDGAFFTAMIPSGWEKEEEILAGRAEKQYGVDLYSPGDKPGAAISLLYFGPDHPRFKTFEKYIATLRDTKDRIRGEKPGKIRDTVVNNRYARTFDRRSYSMVPAYSPKPAKVEMLERFVVVPSKKGFYSLSFKAPKGEAGRFLPIFEKIIATFKPSR